MTQMKSRLLKYYSLETFARGRQDDAVIPSFLRLYVLKVIKTLIW